MTISPHRVGFLGLGLMGQRMLRSMRSHPRFEVVIGCDPAPDHRAIAEAHGTDVPLGTEEEVRAESEIIYIATRPALHVPQALAALRAGRPVFCEKPLCVSLKEADSLVACAEESGLPHAVNFPFATAPGLALIREEIADGRAGAPVRIEVELHFSQWPRSWHCAGPWLAGPGEGGFLREVFSHFAFLTQRLAGTVTPDTVHLDRRPGATETTVAARLTAGTTPVLLTGGAGGAAPDFCRFTWYGTQRSYRLLNWAQLEMATESSPFAPREDASESERGQDQLTALDACLSGKPHPLPDFAEARRVMDVVERLLEQ